MPQAEQRTTSALDALLVDARRDSAEFPVMLANHAPMVLVALDRLGAPAARLADYLARYRAANGLVPVPPRRAPMRRATWTEALGDRSREGDARAFFAGEVARLGIRDALAAYLPVLLPGIGASALHGLMRLAYAVMAHDPAEVATALGAWTATFLPLPPGTGARPRFDDPGQVLAEVGRLRGLAEVVPESDLLWHNMKAVAWTPVFAPVVDWLAIDAATPARMARTALALFAGTMDFAALHALTGGHWLRLLLPVCPEPALMLASFWQAVAALMPKMGCPTLPDEATLAHWRALPCPDWPTIAAAAIASEDEHDISLVFSAREEGHHYGDPLYRVVAARRMRLIDGPSWA